MVPLIDIARINYLPFLLTPDGNQYGLSGIATDVMWEEGEGELAMRSTYSLYNQTINGTPVSSLAALGAYIVVIAEWGQGSEQVSRCVINDHDPQISNATSTLALTGYDELYSLQQSQENYYFPAGTSTKTILNTVLGDWGITPAVYNGPDVAHEKYAFKSEYLGNIITTVLKDAKTRGGPDCFVRCVDGKVHILPKGSNEAIYHFGEDNAVQVRDRSSIASLVTRVKVVGKEDKAGRSPVEAVIDGRTEFGIRQRIYQRTDDSLDVAMKAARELLEESGSPERDIQFVAPDIPMVRRWDRVHITAGTLNGYYLVRSIQHDAKNGTMTMRVDSIPAAEGSDGSQGTESTDFEKGDKVILNGAVYLDSYGNGKGRTFSNYEGTITIQVDTSRACPYHIDHIGWVFPSSITKAG